MEIKIDPEMSKVVERLKGTSYTTNLYDESISAWMRIRKGAEENNGTSFLAATLFLRKLFECYAETDNNGHRATSYTQPWNNFSYDPEENKIYEGGENVVVDIAHRTYRGINIDQLMCISMGMYIPRASGPGQHSADYCSILISAYGAYLWKIINTEKFEKYFKDKKVSWRDPTTWLHLPNGYSQYKLDISSDSDIDLCYFFENWPNPFEFSADDMHGHHHRTVISVDECDKIKRIFQQNKQFFSKYESNEVTIADNELLDLWFGYVFREELDY